PGRVPRRSCPRPSPGRGPARLDAEIGAYNARAGEPLPPRGALGGGLRATVVAAVRARGALRPAAAADAPAPARPAARPARAAAKAAGAASRLEAARDGADRGGRARRDHDRARGA